METEPFLPSSKEECWLKPEIHQHHVKLNARAWPWKRALAVHLFLTLCYTAFAVVIVRKNTFFGRQTHSSAVIQLPVKGQPQLYMNLNHNPFAGPPTPQIDAAWHGLMENINIRVSTVEMERTNQTSVELPEGGGNLAWLGAYHELHCLKIIRQWTYRDHYYPKLTAGERGRWEMHSDHCIEYTRQAAMCHGDTSLTAFEWDATKSKPVLSGRRSPHMCVDWNTIVAFAEERVVSSGEIARLENPLEINAD